MKLVVACLSLAVVTLTAALDPHQAAAEWLEPAVGMDILVDGVAMPYYRHEGRSYVEAVRGREYEIRLHNPYPVRVAVALSVDGLNTIDARHTAATEARKWVINPFDSITIRGWQTSHVQARRFEFTTESASYGQALGRTANLGVITAVFFKERVPPPPADVITPTEPRRGMAAPSPTAPQAESQGAASDRATERSLDASPRQRDDFAATGMGRSTDHVVRTIQLDLEDTPVQTVAVRYEFRPQLVRLGIVPRDRDRDRDRLRQRDRARGFEPEFSPIPSGR